MNASCIPSNGSSLDAEMEEVELDNLDSTGSRSDHPEDEECGDFNAQDSYSTPPFRPESPVLGKRILKFVSTRLLTILQKTALTSPPMKMNAKHRP